jgi:hypothetical protein
MRNKARRWLWLAARGRRTTRAGIAQFRLDQAATLERNLEWYRRESTKAIGAPVPEIEQWYLRHIKRAGLQSQISDGEFIQAHYLVELIVDASGSMRVSLGPSTRMEVAKEAIKTIRASHETGVNFFDTADAYGVPPGTSEEMIGEALVRLDAVFGAADGPPQDHAERSLGVRDGKGEHARATHAAADEMRALDAQVLEQRLAVRGEVPPLDELDAPARLAALAAVEDDAAEFLRQMLEQLNALVDPARVPALDRGVEAARGVHEQRFALTDNLVARGDAIDERARHVVP